MGDIMNDGLPPIAPDVAVDEALPEDDAADVPIPQGPKLFLVHFEQYSANMGQTVILGSALRAEGWDVHIVCRASCRLAEDAREWDLPVHTFPDDMGKGFFAAWKLVRLVRKHGLKKRKEGLLHACDPTASHVVSQAWRLVKSLRIVHTRRIPIMEANTKAIRCYQTPPAKIVTDSLAGKIALRLSGLEPHLLHTIACGVEPPKQSVRRERGDNRIVFAVTGDLLPSSGHSLLFDALVLLGKEPDMPPWEVRILGAGPSFQHLLEEAQSKNIAGRLAFLSGVDTAEQLPLCDILVLPSIEGESHMPLILQGWATGLPLIAINRLDHAENFQNENNCLLAQPGDATELVAQMVRLAKDTAFRTHLVNGGRASLAKFPVQNMVLEYKRLYGQILA